MAGKHHREESTRTPRLLTPAQAAQELNVGRSKAYLLIHAGLAGSPSGLRAILVGKSLRVPADEIQAFIARQLAAQTERAS